MNNYCKLLPETMIERDFDLHKRTVLDILRNECTSSQYTNMASAKLAAAVWLPWYMPDSCLVT